MVVVEHVVRERIGRHVDRVGLDQVVVDLEEVLVDDGGLEARVGDESLR